MAMETVWPIRHGMGGRPGGTHTHGKAIREADPVDSLAHIGEELHRGTVGLVDPPRDAFDEAIEGLIFATDKCDFSHSPFLDVVELGFLEIRGDPEGVGIHEGEDLLSGGDVGLCGGMRVLRIL